MVYSFSGKMDLPNDNNSSRVAIKKEDKMGVIQCPDCKKEVSESAPRCPHCGRVDITNQAKLEKNVTTPFGSPMFLSIVFLLVWLFFMMASCEG